MTEHEITYRIYPPGRVHTEIERDPEEYPYPPDVRIAWAERKEYSIAIFTNRAQYFNFPGKVV